MAKNEMLAKVKARLVYSYDKGWHLPLSPRVPVLCAGVNRFKKGTREEYHDFKPRPIGK